MLTPDSRLGVQASQVAAKVLEGEAIIINLANGLYYSMAGVGGDVWTLIEAERSLDEMAEILSDRYEVGRAEVAADLANLAERLLDEKLVLITTGDGRPEAAPVLPSRGNAAYQAPALQTYDDMAELLALDPPMPGLRVAPSAPSRTEP